MVNLDISWWMVALIIISVLGGYLFGYLYVGRKHSKRTQEIKTRDRIEELNGEILNTNVRFDDWLEKLRKDFQLLEESVNDSVHRVDYCINACNRVVTDHSNKIDNQEKAISDLTEKIEHIESKDTIDELYRLLDRVQDAVTDHSSKISDLATSVVKIRAYIDAYIDKTDDDINRVRDMALGNIDKINDQESAISDLTEEVYSYRDLTDEMDKRFKSYHNMHVNTQDRFSRLEKEIEEMHRHINEETDKLIQIEDEQERMGNRFSWMKTAIAKQLIQTNSLRDDIEAVGAVRQELTGKIKKLKKKLRRMEVGQTNGN